MDARQAYDNGERNNKESLFLQGLEVLEMSAETQGARRAMKAPMAVKWDRNKIESAKRAAAANQLESQLRGRVDQAAIDKALATLASEVAVFDATANAESLLFWTRIGINDNDGLGISFEGNAGITSPGGGGFSGTVYSTADRTNLVTNTSQFYFNITPVYLWVFFYDTFDNYLGHFEGPGGSTVTGSSGGEGTWST